MALTRRGLPLVALIVLELAHAALGIVQHRVPAGHDGFQFFTLQYYFLNNAVQSHDVAQWIPYMNQGTVATMWYAIQASFLQNVALAIAPLLRGVDAVAVYHLDMLADEFILLAGVWLLANRFLRAPAAVFVAVCVMGSTVWLDQPYWNFRLYYALPLVIELGHRFLDSGRWRWFFFAANLLALQSIGNLPYFVPMSTFVVFVYFAAFAAANVDLVRHRARALRWRWTAALAIALGALCFLAAYKSMTIGTESLVSVNDGRNPDGTTTLAGFLTYGGLTDVRKWTELVLNASPWLDNTLYAGVLVAPLLLCGIVVVDRRRLHLILAAAALLLFTLATPLSTAAFYLWPGMKYFRHVGLVSSLVKVFFCFIAGIGFEWLFVEDAAHRVAARSGAAIACAAVLAAGAWFAVHIAATDAPLDRLGGYVQSVDRPSRVFDAGALSTRLRTSARWDVAGALVVGIAPFFLVGRRFRGARAGGPGGLPSIVAAVIVFAAVDVYAFKFAYLFERSDRIAAGLRFTVHAAPMPFPQRREFDLQHALATNDRLAATLAFNPLLRRRFEHRGQEGAQYWTNNAFWFADEVSNTFQSDSWLAPLDALAAALDGRPPLTLRAEHPSGPLVSGVSADKIRFFDRAYALDVDHTAALMQQPTYAGNVLFVAGGGVSAGPHVDAWNGRRPLDADDSRRLSYRVERFDANTLVVSVDNPDPAARWLSYSDVWHPSWHATVNGQPASVYRADIAYKAVAIAPGANVVHFSFGSKLFAWLAAIEALNAACWLAAVAWMLVRAIRPRASE